MCKLTPVNYVQTVWGQTGTEDAASVYGHRYTTMHGTLRSNYQGPDQEGGCGEGVAVHRYTATK